MTLAHISDVHFGRIRDDRIVRALTEDVNAHTCDVVLVTGDLTQRARVKQFREAKAWLSTLAAPALVIPGNHDVHAWWHRPDLRLLHPLRRYKRMITADLMPHFERPGLAVLGLNTAYGRTIKGGYCEKSHVSRIMRYFERLPRDTFKVIAVHHPLAEDPVLDHGLDVARGGEEVLDAAEHVGVNLVCGGHWHLSRVAPRGIGAYKVVIGLAGTAASDRWRAPQRGVNSWHAIRVDKDRFVITVRKYARFLGCFEFESEHKFRRSGV